VNDERARVYTDVRDFPIHVSYMDERTRIWGAPYRIWDGTAVIVGLSATGWAMWHWLDSGHPVIIGILGLTLTAAARWLAKMMPISRPSPAWRARWLATAITARPRRADTAGGDPWLSPPKAVIGNLVFTHGGVYAEYLLAGQPGGMMPHEQRRAVAARHRPLVRQLPSGFVLWGVCAPVGRRELINRMLRGHTDQPRWVSEVRAWEPAFDRKQFWEPVFGLRVPVDAGQAGRSSVGGLAKTWKTIVGAEPDNAGTLDGYRRFADEILAKIPAEFNPVPATPRQIRWCYHRHWTRGTDTEPFPHGPGGPERFDPAHFLDMPAVFDEGDQAGRTGPWWRRWLPSLAPVLRIDTAGGNSYQALLAVDQLPRQGLAHPGAEYLMSVYDVPTDAQVDWYAHVDTRSRERALVGVDRAQRNLDDQAWQTSGRGDLARRYDSSVDYRQALEASKLERETQTTTVVAVGASSRAWVLRAAAALRTHMAEDMEIVLSGPAGAQRALWCLGATGAADQSPRSQFRHPTTTTEWARFAPLASAELGNDTGILLAANLSTARPGPVYVDLEGSAARRDAPGMLWFGPPGGGKSQGCKRVADALIKRGSQVTVIDPGSKREWEHALAHHGDAVAVIDPTAGRWSIDPLRLFPRAVAVEHTLDHLLPLLGVEPDSAAAGQLNLALRDESIPSLAALTRTLRPDGEHPELAAKLRSWAGVDYLRGLFDDTLPVPPIAQHDAVIWLTHSLELPTMSNTDNLHLYGRQSRRARAGLAVYGLIAALTRLTYTSAGRDRWGWLICEEARTYLASPAGREEATRTITQGRKEHYGLIVISQHIEDFDGIPTQDLPMRIITPFKPAERDYARAVFKRMGIDPDQYPQVLDTRTAEGHGYAYFIDHLGRAGLVDLLAPVQPELVGAFDTRNLDQTVQCLHDGSGRR